MEKVHNILINTFFTLSEMICTEEQTYLANVYSKSCKEKKSLNLNHNSRIGHSSEQVLPGGRGEGKVTQIMYTHISIVKMIK
jgi:hypothetical protein